MSQFDCLVLRWSAIATHLPKRTDNEIKNYWNTHLKKRLAKMGIDPVTHKPKNDSLLSTNDGHFKNTANLSHMAQWESARLEAEARLVRQSKLRSSASSVLGSPEFPPPPSTPLNKPVAPPTPPLSLDILKAWNGDWTTKPHEAGCGGISSDLESPTSTVSYSGNARPFPTTGMGESSTTFIEFVGNSSTCENGILKEEGEEDCKGFGNSSHLAEFKEGIENAMSGLNDMTMLSIESAWTQDSLRVGNDNEHVLNGNFVEKFTDLLLNNSGNGDRSFSEGGEESDIGDHASVPSGSGSGSDYYEDNKNYWNNILNLVNSSPSDSPMF